MKLSKEKIILIYVTGNENNTCRGRDSDPDDGKKDDDNEHNEDDDMDNVADVGKLPARRSRRPRMARILSTSSGLNEITKHA